MREVEKHNPRLAGVLPKTFNLFTGTLLKELLKGNYLWDFYGITMLSTLALTVGSLLVASWLFRRESVLLRA